MPQRTRRSPLWRKWLPSWRSRVCSQPWFSPRGWAVQTAPSGHCWSFEFFSPSCRFPGLCCHPPGSLLPPDLLPCTSLWPEQHPRLPHHLLRYRCLLRVLSQGLGNCHQGLLCWPACAAAPTDLDPGHHAGGIHHHADQLPQQVSRHFQHLFGVPHLLRAVHHHRHHHFHHPLQGVGHHDRGRHHWDSLWLPDHHFGGVFTPCFQGHGRQFRESAPSPSEWTASTSHQRWQEHPDRGGQLQHRPGG